MIRDYILTFTLLLITALLIVCGLIADPADGRIPGLAIIVLCGACLTSLLEFLSLVSRSKD